MSLSIPSLETKIKNELEAVFPQVPPPLNADFLVKFAHAMATAIIQEITTNAVAVTSGVQSGGSTVNGTVT